MLLSNFKALPTFSFLASILSLSTLALPTLHSSLPSRASTSPSPVDIVHQFPLGTWVENLAVRKNGKILATILTAPELYQVDPEHPSTPILVTTFPALGCLGIAEVQPDIFYVITGNFSFVTFQNPPGSYSVWKVDMRAFDKTVKKAAKTDPPTSVVSKVANLPPAILLNGMTLLDRNAGLLLLADSGLGVVWRLNVNTGAFAKIIADPSMAAPARSSAVGINGLHVLGKYLYYTNSGSESFFRIPIHADGMAAGPAELLAGNLNGADDFALGRGGNAYIALGTLNEVVRVAVGGAVEVVVEGVPGSTAVAFGRGKGDQCDVYISSNGGASGYVTGNFTAGGAVSRAFVRVTGAGSEGG